MRPSTSTPPTGPLTFWMWGVLPSDPKLLDVGSTPPTNTPSTSTSPRTHTFWMWGVLPQRILPRRVLSRRAFPHWTLTFWMWGVLPRRILPRRVLPPANPHLWRWEYSPDECSLDEYSPQNPPPFGCGECSPCECSPCEYSLDECSFDEYSLQNPHLLDVGSAPLASAPPRTLTFWRWGVLSRRILLRRVLPLQTRVQKLMARLERNIARGGQGSTLRG